jgi:dienelactone hydrolase
MRMLLLGIILSTVAGAAAAASGSAVNYKVNGQPYEGYYISPKDKAPLVMLVHDWDGLTDYEIKRANMLADQGYAVFAVDVFGAGVRPTEVDDKKQRTGALYQDREKMRALMNGALAAAKDKGANVGNAVVMGYCFGGAVVLEMARAGGDYQGYATFHGGLATPQGQDYSKAKGNILVMHGTADTNITMDEFAGLAKELEGAGVKHEMITYSGAPHAFTVFGSQAYREDADKKSWERFQEFLAANLK